MVYTTSRYIVKDQQIDVWTNTSYCYGYGMSFKRAAPEDKTKLIYDAVTKIYSSLLKDKYNNEIFKDWAKYT